MLKVLDKYKHIIKLTKVIRYEQFGLNLRLRIQIEFKDQSYLYVRETIIEGENRKYSYHWQDKNGQLIIRWDNAPDWNVETYPHHKHTEKQVEPSYERTLDQVLKKISNHINNVMN